MPKPFVYMKASRGDWYRMYRSTSCEVWVNLFVSWSATASSVEERAHVAGEASYLLSLPGFATYADRLAPLTRF